MHKLRQLTRSLRGRLLLSMVAMVVLPLTAATVLAVRSSRGAVESSLGTARGFVADNAANWLDRIVYERTVEIQALGSNVELATAVMGMGDSVATRAVLAGVQERNRVTDGVLLYDAAGALVAANTPQELASAEPSAAGAAWFREALAAGRPTYVGPVERAPDGKLRVRMADAVRSASGENLGAVVMDLDWQRVTDAVVGYTERSYARKSGGTRRLRAYIVDPAGKVVGSTRPADVFRVSLAGSGALRGLGSGRSGALVEDVPGL
ncbi:MAG TPA: cache domain-containing protein, partial [Longimicrobiaceae bacterium]